MKRSQTDVDEPPAKRRKDELEANSSLSITEGTDNLTMSQCPGFVTNPSNPVCKDKLVSYLFVLFLYSFIYYYDWLLDYYNISSSCSFVIQDVPYSEGGIILEVHLRNFMFHERLEFTFNPFVNFIIGKNGSKCLD